MEQIARFLFKYNAALLSKGRFAFSSSLSVWLFLALAAALALLLYFLYSSKAARLTVGWRVGLIALRCALVLLIVFCLMRPVVVVPSVVPQSSYALVMVDDSASMKLPGAVKATRLDEAKDLTKDRGSFFGQLAEKFKIRELKFSRTAERIDSTTQITGGGEGTDLSASLEQAARETAGLPTSGIVLITDGADNQTAVSESPDSETPSRLATTLSALRAQGIPVFVIGLGPTRLENDVELTRVTSPRRVISGSPVTAEVMIKSSVGAKTIKLDLTEDNRLIRSQEVPVQPNAITVARMTFSPTSAGVHKYTMSSPVTEGDPAPGNNTQDFVLQVSDSKPRILYFEGEPRWEYGKLRESVAEEKNFELVSVLRTADGKYYRQGIEKPDELADGFPKSEEQLFKYDALVLGSIEATFFTFDQLKAIEQFVARRGGTLIALGGNKSFSAGGYGNTPIADLLPVDLSSASSTEEENETFKAAVADRGRDHPAARLKDDAGENEKAWEHMPAISLPETMSEIKPGATIILEARGIKEKNRVVPLLAEERYGRGKTIAMMASDTWRWRMMLESKDQSFETFWRNLFRYSVNSVRQPIEASTERPLYERGEKVVIKAELSDEKYEAVRDAAVSARLVAPSGQISLIKLNRGISGGVELYSGEFSHTEDGSYRVEVIANHPGQNKQTVDLGSGQTNFLVGDLNREARNAGQNVELLKRIGAETGGGYYSADQTSRLLEDMTHREGPASVRETKELWDMPVNFLLLVGLAAGEWFIRKRKGLA